MTTSSVKPSILIVEDIDRDYEIVRSYLASEYILVRATTIEDALVMLPQTLPVLLILDIELGDDTHAGFKLCRLIRNGGNAGSLGAFKLIPIIMLSKHDSEETIDTGYEEGATVYYPKPLRRELLLGHIRSLLRTIRPPDILSYGIVRLDTKRHIAWIDGQEIPRLTNQEYNLLWQLVLGQDDGVEVKELHEKIIGGKYEAKPNRQLPNNIRMLVSTVRAKLATLDEQYKQLISEERGTSFVWDSEHSAERVIDRAPRYRLLPELTASNVQKTKKSSHSQRF